MCNPTEIKNLIGKEVEISIGEPWDFISSVGDNRLEGKIGGFLPYKDDFLIMLDVSEFDFKGRKVSLLIAITRNRKVRFATNLITGKSLATNFYVFFDFSPQDSSCLGKEDGCLIGSITLKI